MKYKKILSVLLVLVMVLGILPVSAMATESEASSAEFGLTALTVSQGSYSYWDSSTLSLSPTFDPAVTEYTTDKLSYPASQNYQRLYVTATDTEGATIKASITSADGTSASVDVSTGVQTQVGTYVLKSGTNTLTLTVSKEGETDKTYTVTIPVAAKFKWKTDLSAGGLYNKANDVTLSVAVDDSIVAIGLTPTYQWYVSTSSSIDDGEAIADANSTSYTVAKPTEALSETRYYYVVSKCEGYSDLTSKVCEVTWAEGEAPTSITLKHKVGETLYDLPHQNWNEVWVWAQSGDSFQLAAVDENGNETPVTWSGSGYGYTVDGTGLLTITSPSNGQYYCYPMATSKFAGGPSKENCLIIDAYDFGSDEYSATLSSNGQSESSANVTGGIAGHNTWSFSDGYEQYAKLETELKGDGTDPKQLRFTALRPGSFTVSYTLGGFEANELGAAKGENLADNNGKTGSVTVVIKGVAVEDALGGRTKTYLEMKEGEAALTMQLTAYTENSNYIVTWTSSDENIATVDENGLVTAVGVGTTLITAKDSNNKSGGIKAVVSSADKPYFENLAFQTGNTGIRSNTFSFAATKLNYTGVALTSYSVNNLSITKDTLYDADKYTAIATYTDWHGNAMVVPVNSGAATTLEDMFFDTGVLTITLTDKSDSENKTVYTFEMTRPRDTSKQIKSSGIVLVPNGRELSSNLYNNQREGNMFVANSDGSLAQYSGVNSTRYYYRTFAQDGLEAFSLTLAGSTAYSRVRYSIDDGEDWSELSQGGGTTGLITFPARENDVNPVVKVIIQILDDKTYSNNLKADKEGFADAIPTVYTLWVEQLPSSGMKMTEASISHGDWYPAFKEDHYSYNIMVDKDENAPVLTYTVSDGAEVKVGSAVQTAVEGSYTLALTNSYQSVIITGEKGSATYQFRYSVRADERYPNKVVDYLPINSQYTNGGQYGMTPERVITGGDVLSLGNFGGYATFYYEQPLTDDHKNKYGVDFYIYGNSQTDTSTGTPYGFMEPGQVWVSEDGETWYALAGSEHYEDSTLWDYEITYKKTDTGKTSWTDNQGNKDNGTQVGQWPSAANYPLNSLLPTESIIMRGILLPCVDGSVTGNGQFSSMSKGAKFGYVDVLVNSAKGEDANPYLDNDNYQLPSSGFDLAWAVDDNGLNVDVSDKEFHYIKVVTASNLWAGAANEKSTEIGGIMRAVPQQDAVGVTDAPTSITITDGKTSKTVSFNADKQIYELHLGDMSYVSVKVDGATADDNIYVNNQRVTAESAAQGILVTEEGKLLRIIIQNGDKEPAIFIVKLTSNAKPGLIGGIKVESYGADRLADTTDGENYTITVGYRIDSAKITPVMAMGTVVSINDSPIKDSYDLTEGKNIFTIVASRGDERQTIKLTVVRETAPVSSGTITVYFTLLGDKLHGDIEVGDDVHTLKAGNLNTWISKKAYTVTSPATVLDVFEMALTEAGMTYTNEGGNYISEINGLAEFDNGWLSGWMYTLNGTHPSRGVMEQSVKNGDRIVFHYTDDYTKEQGSEKWHGSSSVSTNKKDDDEETQTDEKPTDENADVKPEFTDTTFVDVKKDDWHYESVKYVYENNLMQGTGNGFEPESKMTRAMLVTVLYRIANPEATENTHNFNDVSDGQWYSDAVAWAASNKIVSGVSETAFAPDEDITREQMALIIYRFAKMQGFNVSETSNLENFTDTNNISDWALDAIKWANSASLVNGTSDTTLSPKDTATRAQVAAILMRFCENIAK